MPSRSTTIDGDRANTTRLYLALRQGPDPICPPTLHLRPPLLQTPPDSTDSMGESRVWVCCILLYNPPNRRTKRMGTAVMDTVTLIGRAILDPTTVHRSPARTTRLDPARDNNKGSSLRVRVISGGARVMVCKI
jgi:hypothetical protein